MSKYINEAKKGAKFLSIKKQIEFLTSQLDEKSEVFNPALKKLVCDCMKYEAFSISLVDLQTIKEIDEETGLETEVKILVVGKTQCFDRSAGCIIETELFTKAELNEKQQQCFSTDQFLSSFYYKNSEKIEQFEEEEKEAEKKQKAEQKKQEAEAKKQEAEAKKLATALKLEEAKKQKRIEKAEQVMKKAEQMKQEAKASIEALQQQPAEKPADQKPAEQQPKDMKGKPAKKQKPAKKIS